MRRSLLFAALVAVMFVTVTGCSALKRDNFANGAYIGTVGQELTINGDDFSYHVAGITLAGSYVIDGSAVTFITTSIDGHTTGIEQKSTYDFTSTALTITLTNMRDSVNGGSGIVPDTFRK